MLILSDEEVRQSLPMEETIQAMEESYREVADGQGINLPRQRIRTAPNQDGFGYFFNCIPGLLPSRGVMAVRLDSIVREVRAKRASGRYAGDQYCGWVIVFSLKTSEPLAIMDDFSLSAIRVGATTGVGVKYMARQDANQVALLGSGKQARTNLEAVSKVRNLDQVKIYSPNPDHRRLFAEEMTEVVGAEIIPVDSPLKAMDGASIVLCMGNSVAPLFDGNWLKPGMHVASISAGRDKTHQDLDQEERKELDDTTLERSSRIVISSRAQMAWDEQTRLSSQNHKLYDLGELLQGKVEGRKSDQEINLFASNTGTGNQFAAAGAMVYEKAKERGLGREIPTEWLMSDVKKWADQGFFPSP